MLGIYLILLFWILTTSDLDYLCEMRHPYGDFESEYFYEQHILHGGLIDRLARDWIALSIANFLKPSVDAARKQHRPDPDFRLVRSIFHRQIHHCIPIQPRLAERSSTSKRTHQLTTQTKHPSCQSCPNALITVSTIGFLHFRHFELYRLV